MIVKNMGGTSSEDALNRNVFRGLFLTLHNPPIYEGALAFYHSERKMSCRATNLPAHSASSKSNCYKTDGALSAMN